MTAYQPEVIQNFADRLHARAAGAVIVSSVLGAMMGLMVYPFMLQWLPANLSGHFSEWMSAVFFGVIGFVQGIERASLLRLQAQSALCQMQIERNTRRRDDPSNDNPLPSR